MLLRVQDKDGRGPFKPGFTKTWCEYNHNLPRIMTEFPDIAKDVIPYHKKGMHLGVGVRGGFDGLKKWFSENELNKLQTLGYQVVTINDFDVVRESKNQVIFATKRPLRAFKEHSLPSNLTQEQ